MFSFINSLIKRKYLPRSIIFAFDLFIVLSAFLLSYSLRFNFAGGGIDVVSQNIQLATALIAYLTGFIIFRPFTGIIRHTTTHDLQTIFYSIILGFILLMIFTTVARNVPVPNRWIIPYSIIIMHVMVVGSVMVFSRLAIKLAYSQLIHIKHGSIAVMIYGAGDLGQTTMLAMERTTSPVYDMVGFIDIDRYLQGKRKSGMKIFSPKRAMTKVIPANKVKEIIIAISPERIIKGETDPLVEYCLENHIEVKKVPPVKEWINGILSFRQVRPIEITDLLGRDVINLNIDRIQSGLTNKTILVTGAAGSIGSEIVRQIMAFRTGTIVMLDQAESDLYDLQMELKAKYNGSRCCEVVVADVTNPVRMREVFAKYHPEIIFSAAAYKHVPLMEDNPGEAVSVNIGGTKILADMAVEYHAEKFVMISTDKAVNPTSVMGATKRACEIYVQSLQRSNSNGTRFITTRFGNVLGSNGSVVPLFYRQIQSGGPVTLTHRDIKRYFMTIPEACQLVLEAGFMGQGGEIFIFDMGQPVRIYDLAVKMITLAGFEPELDIKIVETGLRPGEKLFEELLSTEEDHLPTHNPKIMISRTREYDHEDVERKVTDLIRAVGNDSDTRLVARLRELVVEYNPGNERYKS